MHPTKALRVPLALLAAALATLVITAGCELVTDAAAAPAPRTRRRRPVSSAVRR